MGIVVGELVLDGVGEGIDPVGKRAVAFSFWRGVGLEGGDWRLSGRALNDEDIPHKRDGGLGASV